MSRAGVWRCMLGYMVIAWTSLLLTAFGVTGWSWGVACAPLWLPAALLMLLLIVIDVWHPTRDQLRALRRRWSALCRHLGRLP